MATAKLNKPTHRRIPDWSGVKVGDVLQGPAGRARVVVRADDISFTTFITCPDVPRSSAFMRWLRSDENAPLSPVAYKQEPSDPPTVTLELSLEESAVIKGLVGNTACVGGAPEAAMVRRATDSVYGCLNRIIPGYLYGAVGKTIDVVDAGVINRAAKAAPIVVPD